MSRLSVGYGLGLIVASLVAAVAVLLLVWCAVLGVQALTREAKTGEAGSALAR